MTDDTRSRFDRRHVLKGIGAAGVAGLAGCSGGGGGGGGATTDSGGGGTESGGGSSQTQQSQQTQESSAGGGGKLKMAQVKSPIEFDPIVLNDVPSAQIASQIFQGMYTYDESTGLVPELAASEAEVSNNGQRYVLELKKGATFQNGDPVTAEDVKYTLEAPVAEETENASELNMIDTIQAMDERTVQIDLQFPYAAFPNALTFGIVPKSVREQDKKAFNTNSPVGSGPFQFEEWQEGSFARLSRWDDYWGDPMPNLAEIEMVPVEEATTRITTLQNGENDVIEEIPPKLYSTVRNQQNTAIEEVPGIGYFYLAMNCKEGPTADAKAREAVDYCFNMGQAVSNFVEPTGLRQYSPLPKSVAEDWGMPLDEWQGIPHEKDLDEAQRLFDEADVPSDYQWQIIVPPDDKREQIGVTVANGLEEVGFNANVQRLDWGAFLEKYISGSEDDYNMYTLGWSGTPDPDSFTYFLLARTDDVLGVTNGTFYGANSERGKQAVQKFVDARQVTDRDQRKQLYTEGITTVLEDRAHLPAYNLKNSFGVRGYVDDFVSHPVSPGFRLVSDFNNVSTNE